MASSACVLGSCAWARSLLTSTGCPLTSPRKQQQRHSHVQGSQSSNEWQEACPLLFSTTGAGRPWPPGSAVFSFHALCRCPVLSPGLRNASDCMLAVRGSHYQGSWWEMGSLPSWKQWLWLHLRILMGKVASTPLLMHCSSRPQSFAVAHSYVRGQPGC